MTSIVYPETLEQITPEWLSQALSGHFPGTTVTNSEILTRIDGTATKLRYGLHYASPEAAHGAPSSLWIKGGFDPRGASQGDAFINEVRFFRDIAPQLQMEMPACYFGLIDDATHNGLVLLEDLINRGATFGNARQPLTLDQALAVVSLQASYHAAFWNDSRLDAFAWLKAGGAMADANMVDQYFAFWDAAAPRPRFTHLTDMQRDRERAKAALNRLMALLKAGAICLVHGDSHAANLYFTTRGEPGYLDWQHVMRGHWAFDFANFVITSLTVETRRRHERDILKHYLEELRRHGAAAPGFDEAWQQYRRFAMWPFMWVMCPVEAHPEDICTLNAERACTAIDDLETMQLLEAGR